MKGLIHIYEGDGKGKTTAGVGLAVRFAGSGGTVLYTQFLKNDASSEINVMEKLENVEFFPCRKCFGFYKNMSGQEKLDAKEHYETYLEQVVEKVQTGAYGLLVMDEIAVADNLKLIEHETLLKFLQTKPEQLEVVMTGRNPSEDLVELADYVSRIEKIKHPFDRGITARKGIEL